MKSKLEIIIPGLIWIYFFSEAIRGGMLFSTENIDMAGAPLPITFFIFIIVPFLTFLFSLSLTLKPKKMPKLESWIDQRLSLGAYNDFLLVLINGWAKE